MKPEPKNEGGICGRVLGKPKNKAIQKLEINGFKHRIVNVDGMEQMVTQDVNMDRVNLTVINGVVTNAYFG